MKLSSFLIGIVLFSLIVVALAIPLSNLSSNYAVSVDTSFNETYNKVQVIDNTTIDIGEEIRGTDNTFDAFFLAGKVILSGARIVFGSFGIVAVIAYNISVDLGIPPVFVTALTTIVLILVVFGIISLWARFKT